MKSTKPTKEAKEFLIVDEDEQKRVLFVRDLNYSRQWRFTVQMDEEIEVYDFDSEDLDTIQTILDQLNMEEELEK
jgi:hypothetical protein